MKPLLLALVAFFGVAVCAAVGLFLWLSPGAGPASDAGPAPDPTSVARPEEAPVLRTTSAPQPVEARSSVQEASGPDAEALDGEERPLARLVGRCVDARGALLPSVAVQLEDRYGADPTPELEQARTLTDGSGRFQFELPLPSVRRWRMLRLVAQLDGYATLRREVDLTAGEMDLGDLVLAAAGAISGLVLDPGDRPLEGARVVVFGAGQQGFASELNPPWELDDETLSGADGRFRLEAVAVGERAVGAGIDGRFWSYTDLREVRAREELHDVVLRLERIPDDRRITLRVVDPGDQPVPYAQVSWRWKLPSSSAAGGGQADEQGLYEHLLTESTPHSFVVSDQEGRYRPVSLEDVPPGTLDLEVRLGELRTLELVVKDQGGSPVEDYQAQAVRTSANGSWRTLGRVRAHPPYADGRVELIVPDEPFSVRVEAEGFDLAELGPYEPGSPPGEVEVRLVRLPGVRGRVLAGGRPLEGAAVGLYEAPGGVLTVNGFESRYNRHAKASTTSDAQGGFELTLREAGTYWVRVEAEGRAPADLGPLELVPATGTSGLELELGLGGAIEGRVLVPLGEQASGTIVGASRGDGHAVTQRADPQGRFRFESLTPGPWLVVLADEEITGGHTSTSMTSGDRAEPRSNCQVLEGQTTRFDLDLTRGPPVVLEGQLSLSGAAAEGWRASLTRGQGVLEFVDLDAAGRFLLRSSKAGRHWITFEPPAGAGWRGSLTTSVDLAEGTTPWTLDLPVGSLSGRVSVPPARSGNAIVAHWRQGAERYFGIVEPGDDGRYALPVVPAGEVHLSRREEGESISLATAFVVAGHRNLLDIP